MYTSSERQKEAMTKKQKKGVLLYSLDISSNHKSDETRHDYTAVCEDFVIWLRAL
jgi:hypothetical protein